MLWLGISVSHGDELSRYALSVSEGPVTSGDEIADHQVIIRGGQVEAVVVPLELRVSMTRSVAPGTDKMAGATHPGSIALCNR